MNFLANSIYLYHLKLTQYNRLNVLTIYRLQQQGHNHFLIQIVCKNTSNRLSRLTIFCSFL
nr:MAG TPA: hypothetical protein [Caudoviricetes sp.]